jgi:hypothetical protein
VLLYNLGRAYEALGKPEEAADAYDAYLREEPSAVDKRAIEGRTATLRAQAAELAAARKADAPSTAPQPSTPLPQPTDPPPSVREQSSPIVPWIVLATGAAVAGTGLVLGGIAQSRHDEAVNEPVQTMAASVQEDAESYARAATITLVAGAVVALVGAGWLAIRATASSGATTSTRATMGWSF